MSLIPTYPAALFYEVAFNAAPSQTALPPLWTDVTARTVFQWNTTRGRQYELDTVPAGQWNTALDNRDGALDPSNTASAYYPNVVPYRACRIRALTGVNQLTVDQATAGGAGGYLGAIPSLMNVGNDFGYPVTIVASGSAYQGSTVYQAVLPAGAVAFSTVLMVTAVPVVPGGTCSFTAQARITVGTSMSTNVALLWYSNAGVNLASTGGTAQTLTSGSSSWTALTVSGQAPVGATCAYLKVEIASGSTAAQTTWQIDGMQFESSATPTAFQVPQTVSANLLPRVIATGSASMAATDSVSNYWRALAGTLAQALFLTAAPTGQTTALAWTTPSGTNANSPLYAGLAPTGSAADGAAADVVQVTAGSQYAASLYLSRVSSADATIAVTPGIRWYSAAGTVLSSSNGSAATVPVGSWVRATVTGTAPAGAVWGRVRAEITTPSSTTATNTLYAAAWQFEQAASASTWTDPGPTYFIYNGFIERWPQTWTMAGTFGQVTPIGVDAEALLAQDTLFAPFVEELLAMNPNFCYQLADPAGSSSVADSSATRPPAPIENSPYGAGSLTLGSSINSSTPPGAFVGGAGPVATFANNSSNASPFQYAETFVNIAKTTSMPGPPAGSNWTRLLAFRSATTPAGANDYNLWVASPATWESAGNASFFFMSIATGGFAWMGLRPATATGFIYTGTTSLCDGNWHLLTISYNAGTLLHGFYVDGALVASPTTAIGPSGCAADTLGCAISLGTNQYSQGFIGDMAFATEIPAALTATQVTNLYQSWRNASGGESSGARVQRVLTWLGYTGATAIDAGSTSNMGPATDLTGATGLDALNAIALTENGNLYVSSSGVLTFKSRASRYNQNSPSMILGENAAWGEWPYESISLDYDPTHLFNDIQVTQYSTGQVAESIDAASEAAYYQRLLQRTTNQGLYTESVDCANYLLQQYKTARMRISDIILHPSAMPGLFAACLQLEIGARIRVMRRPPAPAAAIAIDCFVESVNWDLDPTDGEVTVHLQCSPADLVQYWTLGAMQTTLAAVANSGANSITINALPDAAYNALASSLSATTQITIDPGTSIAETMTLAPAGIAATSPGYSAAILTFTATLAHTHAAGAIVCEALPAGVTNPATWNPATVLGAVATTFAATASSGASTITLNALSDAKANPAAADWNTGDLLWLSPGTANFEGYNLLSPNQATAGAGALPLASGTAGTAVGINGFYNTPVVTSSGTAFQGGTVWQTAVTGAAATGHMLANVLLVPVTPGLAFTFSAYVRSATSGANPQAAAQLGFIGGATTTGSAATLTGSATASWTRVTVTATAPVGVTWATVGVILSASAPAGAWSFQADGLQVEQAAAASTFQVCPQVLSVGASVPGYTSATLTLTTPLANNHTAGDIVCDPLPPGTTSPTAIAATTRVAY